MHGYAATRLCGYEGYAAYPEVLCRAADHAFACGLEDRQYRPTKCLERDLKLAPVAIWQEAGPGEADAQIV